MVSSSTATDIKPMKRPGVGSSGTRVTLLCNHFAVKYVHSEDIFQYDVTISYQNDPSNKPIISKSLCRTVIGQLRERENMGKAFLFDGDRNLYSLGRLPFNGTREFRITQGKDDGRSSDRSKKRRNDPRDIKDFKVRVAFSVVVDMRSLEVLQNARRFEPRAQDALRVLDILLKEQAAKRNYLLMRDSYFHNTLGPQLDVGNGAISWVGYHASFRPSTGGFSLNLDPSTTIVLKPQTVKEFAYEYVGKNDRQDLRLEDITKVKKILKGVEVQAYTGTKHKLFGFSERPASSQTFELKNKARGADPRTLTVESYYMERYHKKLAFPRLPCVNVGKASRPVYIPMELCSILPGQRYRRKLNGSQIRMHLQGARQKPGQRVQVINQGVTELLKHSEDMLSAFNVKVDSRLMEVSGRVLTSPQLMFGNGNYQEVKEGRWNYTNRQTFAKPATINNWVVVSFADVDAGNVARRVRMCCEAKGMTMPDPLHVISEPPRQRGVPPVDRVQAMFNNMRSRFGNAPPPEFILCILPQKYDDLYAPFKRLFWTTVGIVNQCLVPPQNMQDQYLTNLALKINAKNGGYNSVLTKEINKTVPKVSQVATLIVGMDVSHGCAFSSSSSIAAIVGSVDWPRLTHYVGRASTQARGQETIANIVDVDANGKDCGTFREILLAFYSSSSRLKPAQIVIFRDGVSESQFETVLTVEMQDIVKACDYLETGYRPKITLVVVQKRHHTRFFPAGRGNQNQNVSAGTVVDTGVCHPENFDFFMSSHKGFIGTTRPTHYIVLHDEIGFTPDEMQTFVNDMCHTYVKSTTAVSVVSPINYAHIAAQKHRLLLDEDGHDGGSSQAGVVTIADKPPVRKLPPLPENIQNRMFWV